MKNSQLTNGANPSRRQFIQRCGVLGGMRLTGGWPVERTKNKLPNFDSMIPAACKPALSHHNDKVAVVYMVSYGLPAEAIKEAVADGYFVTKVKIGQSGTQAKILAKDKARLTQVHQAIQSAHTRQTTNGDVNYRNWRTIQTYHPTNSVPWTGAKNKFFELRTDFCERSGGVLEPSDHYEALSSHEK